MDDSEAGEYGGLSSADQLDVLEPVSRLPDGLVAELLGGLHEAGDDPVDGGVADAVEPGLQTRSRAGDHVLGHLVGGKVGLTGVREVWVVVGVGRVERRRS